jgi:hypothetical protein
VNEVWDVSEIADIEKPVMRRTIISTQSGAIHAKRDVQVLKRNVMNDHVVSPLHEGRVNGQKRLQALRGQTAGKKRRMFLGDSNIEVARRMLGLEESEACPAWHGSGDCDDFLI